MKLKMTVKHTIYLLSALLFSGCIESFEPEGLEFQSALVIEATITNQMITQTITLNRAFEFGSDGPEPETNASVLLVENGQSQIEFLETSPGVYTSEVPFAAQEGIEYELQVVASNGRRYASNPVVLTQPSQIDELFAERITADDGTDGIAIMVNSFDPSGNSENYRYEYEETYRVEAPDWRPNDLFLLEGPGIPRCQVQVMPRQQEERVCFPTDLSNTIIQTTTGGLEEDRVSRFVVRFIDRDNFIISFRYSILVRQMIQSAAAFEFFETLDEFSGSGSLFSQIQPGRLIGNVFSAVDEEEIVLGFFDVATVTEQRIFFNYDDFYPGEPLPPFINPCNRIAPILADMTGCILSTFVEANAVRYIEENSAPEPMEGPFIVVPRICGDCTELGPTAIPDFWVE